MAKIRQILALSKSQLIAVWRLLGDELALSVIAFAMPPLPKGEAFASRKVCPFCPRLSHRESPWQAGSLPTGRLSSDMAQKGGPCYRGQRLLDKRTLSSCRESWQRSTTVSDKIRLCSSRVGLTGTPVAPPLGELSPKVTERARMLEGRLLLFRAGHGILKKKKPPTRREKGETET